LPRPKCLMACKVFRLNRIKATAIAATAISRMRTNAYSLRETLLPFREKHCEATINIENKLAEARFDR